MLECLVNKRTVWGEGSLGNPVRHSSLSRGATGACLCVRACVPASVRCTHTALLPSFVMSTLSRTLQPNGSGVHFTRFKYTKVIYLFIFLFFDWYESYWKCYSFELYVRLGMSTYCSSASDERGFDKEHWSGSSAWLIHPVGSYLSLPTGVWRSATYRYT